MSGRTEGSGQEERQASERAADGAVEPGLVWTGAIDAIAARASLYLSAGYGLHLRGPAGTGKATLARALAARRGGEIVIASLGAPVEPLAALTVASAAGATLIVDAEAEGFAASVPRLAATLSGGAPAHSGFRVIVLSRPGAAVPELLLDRLVTIDCDGYDRETELAIVCARSGLGPDEAGRIIDMVRDLRRSREYAHRPSLRCAITLAALAKALGAAIRADDPLFVALVLDVLGARLKVGPDGLVDPRYRQMLQKLVGHFCGDRPGPLSP
jgi:MoxR-like ATPase